MANENLVEIYKAELIRALDEHIEQGILTETDEVTAYRGYVNAITSDTSNPNVDPKLFTWPKKPYAFEVAKSCDPEYIDGVRVDDRDAFHCKNRDYIKYPYKTLDTDPVHPLYGERE